MKQKKKTNSAGVLLTGVVAWVFSFLLVLIAALGVIIFTVCNPGYMRSQVLSSGFCKSAFEQLNENYTSYGNAGNIPTEVMTSIITEDQIQQDMFKAVDALYQGDRRLIAHPEMAETAMEKIEQNLQDRGIQMTDEIKTAIQDVANGCQADYDNYVQLLITPYVAPYITKISTMAWMGIVVLVFAAIFALLVLLNLQKATPARLRWCSYSFLGAAFFSALVPPLFSVFVKMDQLNLNPETLKLLLVSYTNSGVGAFFYFALIYAVIVVALMIAWQKGLKRYRQVYCESKAYNG